MADGLLGSLSGDDKTLGLIAAGIGLLAGNQGRNRRDAFGNALGSGLNTGVGLLNPIMKMQQLQGFKEDRADQRRLQERGLAVQEMSAKELSELRKLEAEKVRREIAARQALITGVPQGSMVPGQDGTQIGIPGQAPMVPGVQFDGQPAPGGIPQGTQPQSGGVGLTPSRIQQAWAAGLPVGDIIKLYELQNPEKKISNGVAFDPRALTHGQVVPGITMSQSGEAMMTIPDPRVPGGVRVAPPPGALDSFSQFQQIRNRAGAEYNAPVRITNSDGTETLLTPPQFRDTAVGSAPAVGSGPRVNTPQQQKARVDVLQAERAAAIARGDSAAVADLDIELGAARLPGIRSGRTTAQQTKDAADRERSVGTARADVDLGQRSIQDIQKEANAWNTVGNTLDLIKERLDSAGVLGPGLVDRVKMVGHSVGIQSPQSINTANIRQLGQALVLSRGSLGAGVSVADADRYDKAAGSFTEAKSEAEMRASIKIMKELHQKYAAQMNQMLQGFRKTGQTQVPGLSAPEVGTVMDGYRFKGGTPSDPNNWEATR